MGLRDEGNHGFEVDKSFVRGDWSQEDEPAFWTLIASAGSRAARFEATKNVSEKDARARAEEKFLTVQALNAVPAAYPGMVTQTTALPDELKPTVVPGEGTTEKTLLLHASSRLTYGVGDPESVTHRALMTFRYCPETRTLVLVELFFSKDEFQMEPALDVAESLSCLSSE